MSDIFKELFGGGHHGGHHGGHNSAHHGGHREEHHGEHHGHHEEHHYEQNRPEPVYRPRESTLSCHSCGASNAESHRFCSQCGASLHEARCSNCNQAIASMPKLRSKEVKYVRN